MLEYKITHPLVREFIEQEYDLIVPISDSARDESIADLSVREYLKDVRRGMMQRCYNKRNNAFSYYGARGIGVCDLWQEDGTAFINWGLANGYKRGLTIDRIDNDGDYEPSNCQWITKTENTKKMNIEKKVKESLTEI